MSENTPDSVGSLGTIIDDLYAGTLDEAAWNRAIMCIVDLLRASGALLFSLNPASGEILRDENHRLDPSMVEEYRRHWTFEDCRRESLLTIPVGCPATELTLQVPRWHRSATLNEFCRPHDVPHFMPAWLHKADTKMVVLGLQGSRQRGAFESRDMETFRRLLPHIIRALEIRDRLQRAQIRADALASCLDSVNFGLVVLDAIGRVLDCNAVAQALIRANGGVRCDRDRVLRLREPAGSQLRGWITTGVPSARVLDGFMQVARRGALPLSILLAPLPNPNSSWIGGDPRWLLFIFDPERGLQASPELISRDLAITAREAELAALLAAGHNLHSAAQRLKVSGHTARGQLKSIFRKTGLHTQAELIRRIALGPASSRVVVGTPNLRAAPSWNVD